MNLRPWLAAAFVIIGAGFASGQVATGTPPFGSFGGGSFDTINLGNLNVHLTIPVFHKAGRGMPFAYDLSYDSSVWSPGVVSGQRVWQPAFNWGWVAQSAIKVGYISFSKVTQVCDWPPPKQGTYTIWSNYVYHDPWGGIHPFDGTLEKDSTNCDNGNISSLNSVAGDGSGYTLSATYTTNTITSRSGQVTNPPVNMTGGYSGGSSTATDANGNQISVSSTSTSATFTDTLGQTAVTASGTSPVTFSYTAPSGSTAQYTMNYKQYTVRTNFGVSGIPGEYGPLSNALVDNIQLPDGSSYAFTYEQTPGTCTPLSGTYSSYCVTARIASVTLPTGGTINYTYSGGSNGIESDGSTASLTRTLNPGGEWKYVRTQVSGAHWQTTITSPPDPVNQGSASDVTLIDFQQDSSTKPPTSNFYETQRKINQGASTLLATVTKCYNTNYANCSTTAVSSPITQTDIYSSLPNGSTRASEVVYNSFGLVTDEKEYNYGVALGAKPSSTYLVRETSIPYASLGNGIVNRPASVTVYDWTSGTAKTLASSGYSYDQRTPAGTSGTPQHIAITGSRGNVTTITTSTNSTVSLSRTSTYYDTGMPNVATDVNGTTTTTYAYSQATQGSTTASCGNSFPTGVTVTGPGVNLSTSTVWNCAGGVATQTTDSNGNNVTANYIDADFWRPANISDEENNETTISYSGQTAVESALQNFNGGSSVSDFRTTVDGFGRHILSQRLQGPGATNYDTVETDYDTLGQRFRSTMPFSAPAGSTNSSAPGTTSVYDALGRVRTVTDANGGQISYVYTNNDVLESVSGTQTFQKQLEYDGLGRLTSVCEMSSTLQGVGTCAQSSPQTGLWTTYTYDALGHLLGVTQNAQAAAGSRQTRSFVYDRLGRMTSESNPETGNSGTNGTISYTYDLVKPCGDNTNHVFPGDLVQKIDNAGNITCFSYDGLHRVVTEGNTTVTNTTLRKFFYDSESSYPTGVSVGNGKTHMVEAETFNTSNLNAFVTDEFFSYSPRGELTDVYEATPHSGSGVYFHTTASYWPTGALQSLGGIPGVPTINYGANGPGLDGEGRYTQVTAASGTNPVSSVTYSTSSTTNPLGALTGVTFPSADSDSFTYDPNIGRLSTYTFTVNGATDQGTLKWNTNGTLQQLTIVDNIPGTNDTQTCNYQYDDVQRVSSSLCGSVWQQNFTYDSFGNIKKSGSGTFAPLYPFSNGATTNQFFSIPGVSVSYDKNGNLLTDNLNSYTWDPNWGNMLTVNTGLATVTNTYDALGRMVENNAGGTYREFVYGPTGAKLAIVNGTTLIKAFIALPGGAKAIYNSSGALAYYRHSDWLSSSRLTSTATKPTSLYSSSAYAPFGEQYATAGTADASFNGQDQDTVSSLYDFPARRQSPSQGRWISPDPAGLAVVNPANPQSWNRYAHVYNNPLALIDPSGLDVCGVDPDVAHVHAMEDPDPFQCEVNGGGSGGGDGSATDSMASFFPDIFCSAEYSSADCGGLAGLYSGNYGDAVAQLNLACQGMSSDACSGYLRYSSIIKTGYDPFGDPCVYTNDDGSYNVDTHSSPSECSDTEGHWVPPGWTFNVDQNGNVNVFAPPLISPNTCLVWQGASAWLLGFNAGVTVASGGAASVGFIVTVPNFVLSQALCGSGGATHL